MKPIQIQNLDQFLRPLQVDGVSTGIELSTEGLRITAGDLGLKSLTAESARINGDINVDGNLTVTDTDTGKGNIDFPNTQSIKGNENAGQLTVESEGFVVDSLTYGSNVGADKDSGIALIATSGKDSSLSFFEGSTNRWRIGHDATDNSLKIDSGAAVGGNTFLELSATALTVPNGDIVAGDDIAVAATGKLSLDGVGGHTYIVENSDDTVRFVVGGDVILHIAEQGDDGNQVFFSEASAGFTQLEPTYGSITTLVDFRKSNKQNLTFGAGNIGTLQMIFPDMSGNFQLLLKQDGLGNRTVTNYNVHEADESAADGSSTVVWAGGSNPTLTTDANHVDILSFYYDADNEIAYGVATLDFQF